jgi:hypothetical protein
MISEISANQNDWNKFARDCLGVRLDRVQRRILEAIQTSRRTSVTSCHRRGKDYVAAVASLCYLYNNYPAKVIETAPTDRQVESIMMAEISSIHRNARIPLGGDVQTHRVMMPNDPNWFLIGFVSNKNKQESWTGYNSPHSMIVITEASGVPDETFNAIEGILAGENPRLVLMFNPVRCQGEAYQSTRSPLYAKFKLSVFSSPNVRAKKILIPGQIDYEWIVEKLRKPGWVTKIEQPQVDVATFADFKFDGQWYRPSDICRVKMLGEFPREADDQLIPLGWVEAANDRWREKSIGDGPLLIGADIAGMGNDNTVFAHRRGNVIEKLELFAKADHMVTAGRLKNLKAKKLFIDTIGEGAGVYSRLKEMNISATSAKFSDGCLYHDKTGERDFLNMRAYCYWAVRDALDPKFGINLALPPDDELTEELTALTWFPTSSGKVQMVPKDDIKKSIGRSPDKADAVALSFWPGGGSWGHVSSGERK